MKTTKSTHGGRRPGAGRPRTSTTAGTTQAVLPADLLEALQARAAVDGVTQPAAGERHHQEQRAQMAELRDAKLVEHINDYLDAFEDTLTTRHLDDLAAGFRAFRKRTGEDGTIENRALLTLLERSKMGGGQ